jgi:hypothetical protein
VAPGDAVLPICGQGLVCHVVSGLMLERGTCMRMWPVHMQCKVIGAVHEHQVVSGMMVISRGAGKLPVHVHVECKEGPVKGCGWIRRGICWDVWTLVCWAAYMQYR